MAGSYEHLKRDENAYGGVNTSMCENMGDAIEAMVHMYWMIELLAKGDQKLIRRASDRAIKIETGQSRPPVWALAVPTNEGVHTEPQSGSGI